MHKSREGELLMKQGNDAMGRREGTLIESMGQARQWEDVPATRTSAHTQSQNCTAFKAR